MLAIEDSIVALEWAKAIGGQEGLEAARRRQRQDRARLDRGDRPWLATWRRTRRSARTPACAWCSRATGTTASRPRSEAEFAKKIAGKLEKRWTSAYDLNGYRDAPPCLRIWCGGSLESADIEAPPARGSSWAYAASRTLASERTSCRQPLNALLASPRLRRILASGVRMSLPRKYDQAQSPHFRQDGPQRRAHLRRARLRRRREAPG